MKYFIMTLFAVMGLNSAVQAQSALDKALDTPLMELAVDYETIPLIDGCEPAFKRAPLYHECRDSRAIYDKAIANAKAKKQALMVIFGFNTCPACRAYESLMFDPAMPLINEDLMYYASTKDVTAYEKAAKPTKISLVRIHARSPHGLKLADDIGVTDMAKARGWHRVWSPFVLFVNPETGAMHSERYWEAEDTFCDARMELAVNMEAIGMANKGTPLYPRKRCAYE